VDSVERTKIERQEPTDVQAVGAKWHGTVFSAELERRKACYPATRVDRTIQKYAERHIENPPHLWADYSLAAAFLGAGGAVLGSSHTFSNKAHKDSDGDDLPSNRAIGYIIGGIVTAAGTGFLVYSLVRSAQAIDRKKGPSWTETSYEHLGRKQICGYSPMLEGLIVVGIGDRQDVKLSLKPGKKSFQFDLEKISSQVCNREEDIGTSLQIRFLPMDGTVPVVLAERNIDNCIRGTVALRFLDEFENRGGEFEVPTFREMGGRLKRANKLAENLPNTDAKRQPLLQRIEKALAEYQQLKAERKRKLRASYVLSYSEKCGFYPRGRRIAVFKCKWIGQLQFLQSVFSFLNVYPEAPERMEVLAKLEKVLIDFTNVPNRKLLRQDSLPCNELKNAIPIYQGALFSRKLKQEQSSDAKSQLLVRVEKALNLAKKNHRWCLKEIQRKKNAMRREFPKLLSACKGTLNQIVSAHKMAGRAAVKGRPAESKRLSRKIRKLRDKYCKIKIKIEKIIQSYEKGGMPSGAASIRNESRKCRSWGICR